MIGIFDEHLPVVNSCNIVGTVNLYKYWPLVKGMANVCLLIRPKHDVESTNVWQINWSWKEYVIYLAPLTVQLLAHLSGTAISGPRL